MARRQERWTGLFAALLTGCVGAAGVEVDEVGEVWGSWTVDGEAQALVARGGAVEWARWDGLGFVRLGDAPPGADASTQVLAAAPDELYAITAPSREVWVTRDGTWTRHASIPGEAPLAQICGEVDGRIAVLGVEEIDVEGDVFAARTRGELHLVGDTVTALPAPPEGEARWGMTCFVSRGALFVRADGRLLVLEGDRWAEAPSPGDGAGALARVVPIRGATYLWADGRLVGWDGLRRAWREIAPLAEPERGPRDVHGAHPEALLVAYDVHASTGCFYRFCGSRLDHVEVQLWDGARWSRPLDLAAVDGRGLTVVLTDDAGTTVIVGGTRVHGPF